MRHSSLPKAATIELVSAAILPVAPRRRPRSEKKALIDGIEHAIRFWACNLDIQCTEEDLSARKRAIMADVRKGISKCKAEGSVFTIDRFLNNFRLHLPDVHNSGRSYYRRDRMGRDWERTYDEILSETRDPGDAQVEAGMSALILGQTPSQFYATLDSLIELAGISGLIAELSPDIRSREINWALLPVYVAMRLLGYNHYPELVG